MTRPTISNFILGIRRLRRSRSFPSIHPISPHPYILSSGLVLSTLVAIFALTISTSAIENIKEQNNTISLSVTTQCSFVVTDDNLDNNYEATGANGTEASFSNNNGVHNFNIACNQFSGYTVKAYAEDLVNTEDPTNTVAFYNYAEYTPRVENNSDVAIWSAEITSGGDEDEAGHMVAIFGTDEDHMEIIKSRDTASEPAGDPFSVQYHAYIGRTTAPGVYNGKAVYTITMNPYTPTTYMYSVVYHANGITGTPATQYGDTALTQDTTITLSTEIPTYGASNFLGWDTNPTASTVVYTPGQVVTIPKENPILNLYAVWDDNSIMANGAAMQNMTALSCANASADTTYTLTDSRTGSSYLVGKLADGNCWMLQNLYLPGGQTLSDTDSNLTTKTSYTLPASDQTASGRWNSNTNTTGYFYAGTHKDATADEGYEDSHNFSNTGSYFSYVVATAGQVPTDTTSPAPDSVCPKNWKLPTGGASGQFQALYTAYSSNYDNMKSAFKAAYTSYCHSSGCPNSRNSADWWSSTIYSATYGYYMTMNNGSFYPQNSYDKYNGYSVRCVFAG